jgi:hypothetical protein
MSKGDPPVAFEEPLPVRGRLQQDDLLLAGQSFAVRHQPSGNVLIAELRQHTQVKDPADTQPLAAKLHLANGQARMSDDALAISRDYALCRRVARLVLLELKLGGRWSAKDMLEQLMDGQMVADASR